MSAYIKFWLAKQLAELLILAAIVSIPIGLFAVAYISDWIQRLRRRG